MSAPADDTGSVLDAIDLLARARSTVAGIEMAALALTEPHRSAIAELASSAVDMMEQVRDMLDAHK
jgi:hypothetical protein